jgi:DNA helicase HerA-like ATPase
MEKRTFLPASQEKNNYYREESMFQDGKIFIGKSGDEKVYIYPKMANRHGLIAGATGTGKTVSLKVLAESFSDCGVPVFFADVKGDLAGMCNAGTPNENVQKRIDAMGLAAEGFDYRAFPTEYWDVYGEYGLPLRTTISEMGPLLLGRIMDLNDTQTDILTIVFKIADDENMLLIDTKDLRSMLQYVAENAAEYSMKYGNINKQSVATITRNIVALESEGAELFFGEPALDIKDWIKTDMNGKGMIQILDCRKLINNPTMYATFLLWMMSELFETLPEVGDLEKPRMIFFFDEAHLLFDDAPKNLKQKIEQVVKLIRSKGVGIYFVTQKPSDVPDGILSQLGNKIQHALRAYTPAEQKAAKAAADAYRANPDFDTYDTLMELGTGEALVSVLDEKGTPTMVQRTKILPPQSQMDALDENVRQSKIKASDLYIHYAEAIDRDSAYEFLCRHAKDIEAERERLAKEAEEEKARLKEEAAAAKAAEKEAIAAEKAKAREEAAAAKAKEREEAADARRKKSAIKGVGSTVIGTVGRELGNSLGKKVGGTFGKKLGGNLGAALGRGLLSTFLK